MVEESLKSIPFLNAEIIESLKTELPVYLASAADTSNEILPLEWWKRNSSTLPNWSSTAKKVCLIHPSSASAERVFSRLSRTFGDQQDNSLEDYIEASVMLQFNKDDTV